MPWGFEGPRRRVDFLIPERHVGVLVWQLLGAGLVLVGLLEVRARPELVPWLALLVGKIVATVAFFGYARHGATVIPVIVLLASLGMWRLLDRWANRPPWIAGHRLPVVMVTIVMVLELVRFFAPPTLLIDDRPVGPGDPWPIEQHEDRRISRR